METQTGQSPEFWVILMLTIYTINQIHIFLGSETESLFIAFILSFWQMGKNTVSQPSQYTNICWELFYLLLEQRWERKPNKQKKSDFIYKLNEQ